MTVLSAAQEAARRLNQTVPSSLFAADNEFALELLNQANESAIEIAKTHDWQKLIALHTLTGDGTTTSFSLPSDYDRMLQKGEIQTSALSNPYVMVSDYDEWLYFQIHPEAIVPGYWIILGNMLQFNPAIPSGVDAKFYYVKNTVVTGNASAQQTSFQTNTDYYNLSERLLTLDMAWRWKSQKGLDYSEAMRNFEIALEQEISRDRGPRVFSVGRKRMSGDFTYAYPRPLGA